MSDAKPRCAEHLAHSFPPIAGASARLLILGSMPGLASLRAGQYYAHPRNQFWPIMSELLGRSLPPFTYPERVRSLLDADIALWDVLQSCNRPGSLDADIARDSIVVNDFAAFFRRHPGIDRVYFNGAAAEKLFLQHGLPQLKRHAQPHCQRLPSTSPAYAALDFKHKLNAWRRLIDDKHLQTRAN